MMSPRAVVLGLDGGTWDVVKPWVEAGALPTFARLMHEGAWGRLRSTSPPITPVAWPTIYTGVNAGKHGILGFEKRVEGAYRWAKCSALDMRRRPLWDLVGDEGGRSCILFAPYTFPTRPIEGAIVAGRGAPTGVGSGSSSPTDLAPELATRFGEHHLFGPRRPPGQSLNDIARGLVTSIERQTDAVEWMLTRDSFDLLFAVWDQTDTAGHLLWHHSQSPCPDVGSPMFEVYAAIDRSFERLLQRIGDDCLILVCSDHGAYPITHRVRIPLWLEREGFLARERTIRNRAIGRAGDVWVRMPESLKARVPARIRRGVGSVHEGTFRQLSLIEWDRTRAYPQPVSAEAFYLNLRGREPRGVVPGDAADDVLAELSLALKALEAPDGRSLVEGVARGDETFTGPYTDEGPDLIAHVSKGVYFSPTPAGKIFDSPEAPRADDPPRSLGYHDPEGMVLLHGPGVAAGSIEGARVEDIAPTLLRYLKAAVPNDVDGVGLDGAFSSLTPARERAPEPRFERHGELSEKDEADIERQLRDLGYIE